MVCSRVHRSFLLFSCIFRECRIPGNSRKRIFSSVHRSVNARKLLCVPAFSEVSLHFLWQQMRVNARKRLFFQCSPFDELLVNIVSSFLGQWVPVNPSKRLFPGDQCFHLFFLHFLGRCIRVFFSAHRPALLAHSHPVFKILLIFLQSHDLLATNVQGT